MINAALDATVILHLFRKYPLPSNGSIIANAMRSSAKFTRTTDLFTTNKLLMSFEMDCFTI